MVKSPIFVSTRVYIQHFQRQLNMFLSGVLIQSVPLMELTWKIELGFNVCWLSLDSLWSNSWKGMNVWSIHRSVYFGARSPNWIGSRHWPYRSPFKIQHLVMILVVIFEQFCSYWHSPDTQLNNKPRWVTELSSGCTARGNEMHVGMDGLPWSVFIMCQAWLSGQFTINEGNLSVTN